MVKQEEIEQWLEIIRKYLKKYQSIKLKYEDGREFGLMTAIQLYLYYNETSLLDDFDIQSTEKEELKNALVNLIDNKAQDQFVLKVVNHTNYSNFINIEDEIR